MYVNCSYLDGQRVQIDLLQGLDLHVLNQAAQLGDWHPLSQERNSSKLQKAKILNAYVQNTY